MDPFEYGLARICLALGNPRAEQVAPRIRERADDGDFLAGFQGQSLVGILQQHEGFAREAIRRGQVFLGVESLLLALFIEMPERIVEQA